MIRSFKDEGRTEPFVFAECSSYPAAMEVASLGGDRVFTEGQMLDHPERRRALTAWDKGEGPHQRSHQPAGAHLGSTTDTLSMDVRHG